MNTKTLSIKAKLANHIRKTLYKKRLTDITTQEKEAIFNEIFSLNHSMHWELNFYKDKRKDARDLRKKREAAPQTKTMIKKLNPKKRQFFDKEAYENSLMINSLEK